MRTGMLYVGVMAAVVTAQVPESQPRFEVASVKLLATVAGGQLVGAENIVAHPGSLSMRNVRLRSCIKWAYNLKEYQLDGPSWLGAPGWLGSDVGRYDIVAKAAENTPVPELRQMLQALLVDRFKLAVHRETREVHSYALVVVRSGPELHPSAAPNGEREIVPQGPVLSFRRMTLAEFAEFVSGPLGAPVLDMTNLSGQFDFKIDVSPYESDKADQQYAFIKAIQEQLGLKLDSRKSPIETLVIDHMEKVPTEN
jgi:uncharacterized protein (TIGR03435 family)